MIRILKHTIFVVTAILVVVAVSYLVHLLLKPDPNSPEGILERADQMAWVNNWIGAEPLFHQAEEMFSKRSDAKHALYAEVSRIPARMEAKPLAALIVEVNRYLSFPKPATPTLEFEFLPSRGCWSGSTTQDWRVGRGGKLSS